MSHRNPPRQGPFRLQFSLRSLLILTTVSALLLGLYMQRVTRFRQGYEAILAIGGNCFVGDPPPTMSPSIRNLLGPDFWLEVTIVDLAQTDVDDEWLRHFQKMPKVREINLENTRISDAGLVHLQNLKDLKHLNLRGTDVTPQGVRELQKALPDCTINYSKAD